MPTLYIIAGSNGAGKSSTGPGLLPEMVIAKHPPFDGDKLKSVKQLEFRPQVNGSWKEAGRLADEYVYEEFERQYKYAIGHCEDFVYEGHFTEDESWELITTFKNKGYVIVMLFMGLNSVEVSKDRVFTRAKKGGHQVPEYEIEKNFYGNLYKLNKHFELFDRLIILDSSERIAIQIAECVNGIVLPSISENNLPNWFIRYLPSLYKKGHPWILSDR